jgi:hypothetical protein
MLLRALQLQDIVLYNAFRVGTEATLLHWFGLGTASSYLLQNISLRALQLQDIVLYIYSKNRSNFDPQIWPRDGLGTASSYLLHSMLLRALQLQDIVVYIYRTNRGNFDPLVLPRDGLKLSTPKHFVMRAPVTVHCTVNVNHEQKQLWSTGLASGRPQVIYSIACCYAPPVTGHCTENLK